jgi:hypothetical protein
MLIISEKGLNTCRELINTWKWIEFYLNDPTLIQIEWLR